jgi:hypothetical protein
LSKKYCRSVILISQQRIIISPRCTETGKTIPKRTRFTKPPLTSDDVCYFQSSNNSTEGLITICWLSPFFSFLGMVLYTMHICTFGLHGRISSFLVHVWQFRHTGTSSKAVDTVDAAITDGEPLLLSNELATVFSTDYQVYS